MNGEAPPAWNNPTDFDRMQQVVIVIHLMLVLALIGVVLLQRSEGGGLGIGSTSGFMTTRGTGNVLTKTTWWLAGLFFATSLLLSWLAGYSRQPASILPNNPAGPSAPAPGSAPPASSGGLLNQLQGNAPPAQPAPAAPSGPSVPQSQ